MAGGERSEAGRTKRQRLRALGRANHVRTQRASVKRALRAGEAEFAELVSEPPGYLLTATVAELLAALPGYGEVRVRKTLRHCQIPPLKTIGGLTERQRAALVAALAPSGA